MFANSCREAEEDCTSCTMKSLSSALTFWCLIHRKSLCQLALIELKNVSQKSAERSLWNYFIERLSGHKQFAVSSEIFRLQLDVDSLFASKYLEVVFLGLIIINSRGARELFYDFIVANPSEKISSLHYDLKLHNWQQLFMA